MPPAFPPGVYQPTAVARIAWGKGSLATQLPAFLSSSIFPAGPVFLLTGNSLRNTPELLNKVTAALGDRLAVICSDITQHSPIAQVHAALAQVEKAGAKSIVSFGGGSVIDAAKTISYYHNEKHGHYLTQLAIPTTLSAAEVTILAGTTNEKGMKSGVRAEGIIPQFIIFDPELTAATPEKLWLSTGLRALDHAVEGLYRPSANPIARTLGVSAIKDLFTYLPASRKDPNDLDARASLQVACWKSLGNEIIPSGMGLSHSLGHRIGASYAIPHGITSCITLGPTIGLLARTPGAFTDRDVYDIEQAVAALPPSFVPASSKGQHPGEILSKAVKQLVEELGLTSSMSEYKVPESDIPDIAAKGLGGLAGFAEDRKPPVESVIEMLKNECYRSNNKL